MWQLGSEGVRQLADGVMGAAMSEQRRSRADGPAASITSVSLLEAKHVAVVGMMGAGKTSFAKALASALERPYFDSDDEIEKRFGCTGAQLAAERGVAELHKIEASLVLEHVLFVQPCVFSAAASVVENDDCVRALKEQAVTAWVDTPIDVLVKRMTAGVHRRTMSESELVERFDRRLPLFEDVAAVTVDGLLNSAAQVAQVFAATEF